MRNRRHFLAALGAPLLAQTITPQDKSQPEREWHDVKTLTVEGLGFKDQKAPYDRLPLRAEAVVRKAVWDLSRDSAGVAIRFLSDAPTLSARWTLTNKNLAGPNQTAIAASGLDLYAKTDAGGANGGKWRWVGIGSPTKFPDNNAIIASSMPPGLREYMLYLPLRNVPSSVEVGVPKGSSIQAAPARRAGRKSIVFYGTSITHGASASRAGMTHVAMLGRALDRETVNLGFAGNGKMEPDVTKFVAELDPAVFVVDCLPNMTAPLIHENAAKCVSILRDAHPEAPILLVEDRNYGDNYFNEVHRKLNESNHAALREEYSKMQAAKIPHLHYLKGDDLLGDDGEATIDSSHPTDLGFVRQAAEFEKALRKILK